MKIKTRLSITRIVLFVAAAGFLIFFIYPMAFLLYNYATDKRPHIVFNVGYTDDASKLNKTKVAAVVKAQKDPEKAIIQISDLVKQARSDGKVISIAGAKHTMGGHTIYPDGIQLDMKSFHYMRYDRLENCLLVGSGALWSEIIPYLDKMGKSVSVMQSNNSFSVGGSISANCHGWQANSPPIASTVRSFRLIDSQGKLLNCSRTENLELFSLVLGGYGLFGVILDVKLNVVQNDMYSLKQHLIRSEDYVNEYDHYAGSKAIMVYGRINVNPDSFMEEAIISTFIRDTASIQPLYKPKLGSIRRTVFRSSAESEYGKNTRWKLETMAIRVVKDQKFARNQIFNEGVEIFENTDPDYTDILHEYFIPRRSVPQFIKALRSIIPRHKVDLLNITVRNVMKDGDTFLKYANEEVFGFVMLFNQPTDPKAEPHMKALTQKLIDTAISLEGTYYLPYRLHATKAQMYKAYPQAPEFFALKKKYDPTGVFQNMFYREYK